MDPHLILYGVISQPWRNSRNWSRPKSSFNCLVSRIRSASLLNVIGRNIKYRKKRLKQFTRVLSRLTHYSSPNRWHRHLLTLRFVQQSHFSQTGNNYVAHILSISEGPKTFQNNQTKVWRNSPHIPLSSVVLSRSHCISGYALWTRFLLHSKRFRRLLLP